jgi:alpha-glutamyl/putrescinyl thymine pyrophosphorylase-like protein
MWPSRSLRLEQLDSGLLDFSNSDAALNGVTDGVARRTLAAQMIASLRRLDYTTILKRRDIHPGRADPDSDLFDPERAALFYARKGDFDEAIWLIFLSIHFGKHGKHGWRMVSDVYSGLGTGRWTWERASARPDAFREWLRANRASIRGAFGNHRKYETLDPNSNSSTALVIESFNALCSPSPSGYFATLVRSTGNDPTKIFDAAYRGLTIARFGRLAKFDFLSLLGRMDLAPLRAGSAYLRGATGPLRGARLLVDGDAASDTRADDLDAILQRLDGTLGVGMQVMEDSICNWQKSPRKFIHFRG